MEKPTSESNHYLAYLLRFWREDETSPWRVTVENPHTGERRSFSAPDHLWSFLQDQLVNSPPNRRKES
ncbi:MAG: hypothetical protein IPF56_18225 [Chloroflexi bacterium]|nr:hypothetical protein [Chloroflexota bacterium]MBK6713116.1 hypothetical protein [Chloroflexota bacterium]MBK7181243.1 hypothetical protein [Chloroflexota bacterium]